MLGNSIKPMRTNPEYTKFLKEYSYLKGEMTEKLFSFGIPT